MTAIDRRDQAYRRANRGDYIAFAALGVDLVSATGSFGGQPVSGTSFAAPTVAAALLRRLVDGHEASAVAALDSLRGSARDLGPAGRDPIYGWGAIEVAPR